MFGLGSKKSASTPPAKPQGVFILTTEYLLEGYYDPERDNIFNVIQEMHDISMGGMMLTSVKVQSAGALNIPIQVYPKWVLGFAAKLVAIIPRDEAAQQSARDTFSDYNQPFPVTVYAGQYMIRATLLCTDNEPENVFSAENLAFVPLANAEISSLTPGSKLGVLKVPWLVLNGGQVHGFAL